MQNRFAEADFAERRFRNDFAVHRKTAVHFRLHSFSKTGAGCGSFGFSVNGFSGSN